MIKTIFWLIKTGLCNHPCEIRIFNHSAQVVATWRTRLKNQFYKKYLANKIWISFRCRITVKYQLFHNCTSEAFLLLSLKSFLSNRESRLKITIGPNQCGCFYDFFFVDVSMFLWFFLCGCFYVVKSDHPVTIGAVKGGIRHNRKAERIRLDLRDHRYAVTQSLSDAVQGSGLMVIHTAKVIWSYSSCD